jgi:hypothetical protein
MTITLYMRTYFILYYINKKSSLIKENLSSKKFDEYEYQDDLTKTI